MPGDPKRQSGGAVSLYALIVVYQPRLEELRSALQTLLQAQQQGQLPLAVAIWHNDGGPAAELATQIRQLQIAGLSVTVHGAGGHNLGFGCANNALLEAGAAAANHVLLLNQDAIPEPGALQRLWDIALADDPDVAAWEMRQVPYEHPKDYDPVTGETGWCSAAALLIRADALKAVGGFEPRFFMYCEDVDLSWRLRCAGWRLRYVPQAAVVHRTYSRPAELKPLMVTEGRFANLCLRTRFAGRRQVLQGLRAVRADLQGPEGFEGHHRGLRRGLLKFARHYAYFRLTRCAGPMFEPLFVGWDFEQRREGAFHPFLSQAERAGRPTPRVSVLLHTHGNAQHLHERLTCLAGQTLPVHELVVVNHDDSLQADERLHAELRRWRDRLPLFAVSAASEPDDASRVRLWTTGDWLLILPDDELRLYADHLEVLAQAATSAVPSDASPQAADVDVVRSLGWHLHTRASEAARAHRFHAGRSLLRDDVGGAGLLRHRRQFESDTETARPLRTVEVEKLTWLRYDPDGDEAPAAANANAAAAASR